MTEILRWTASFVVSGENLVRSEPGRRSSHLELAERLDRPGWSHDYDFTSGVVYERAGQPYLQVSRLDPNSDRATVIELIAAFFPDLTRDLIEAAVPD